MKFFVAFHFWALVNCSCWIRLDDTGNHFEVEVYTNKYLKLANYFPSQEGRNMILWITRFSRHLQHFGYPALFPGVQLCERKPPSKDATRSLILECIDEIYQSARNSDAFYQGLLLYSLEPDQLERTINHLLSKNVINGPDFKDVESGMQYYRVGNPLIQEGSRHWYHELTKGEFSERINHDKEYISALTIMGPNNTLEENLCILGDTLKELDRGKSLPQITKFIFIPHISIFEALEGFFLEDDLCNGKLLKVFQFVHTIEELGKFKRIFQLSSLYQLRDRSSFCAVIEDANLLNPLNAAYKTAIALKVPCAREVLLGHYSIDSNFFDDLWKMLTTPTRTAAQRLLNLQDNAFSSLWQILNNQPIFESIDTLFDAFLKESLSKNKLSLHVLAREFGWSTTTNIELLMAAYREKVSDGEPKSGLASPPNCTLL